MHTFVIPVYNDSPYLEQCIESLISQTQKSAIILTTSTPTVLTKQLAEKYHLPYFINYKTGIANDWNFALSKSPTSLVTIAHQDDIYDPAYAELVINLINDHPDLMITFTDYQDIIKDSTRKVSLNSLVKKMLLFPFLFKKIISHKYLKKMILSFGDPICCPSVTFNLKALNGFRFDDEFSCALDWNAWYQLAGKPGAFGFINKKLVKHRIHPESETTVQLSAGIRKQEELKIFKMIWGNRAAAVLAWIYRLGHVNNQIKPD